MEPQHAVLVPAAAFVLSGLALVGLGWVLSVIAFFRILASGGKVRGFPHSLFAFLWSSFALAGAAILFVVMSYDHSQVSNRSQAARQERSHARFQVELGPLELRGEPSLEESVAAFASSLAESLVKLEEASTISPEGPPFDVGVVEVGPASRSLTFDVQLRERDPGSLERIARTIRAEVNTLLDRAFLERGARRTWTVSYTLLGN